MIKKTVFLLFISFFAVVLPIRIAHTEPTTEIMVSAAISLQNAFEEIGKLYELQYKNSKITLNLGASGDLMTQNKGGASADMFASAARKDMDVLGNAGFVVKDSRTNFVENSGVFIVPSTSKITLGSFEDLKNAEIKKIAVGNPKTVYVGRYSNETFQYFDTPHG